MVLQKFTSKQAYTFVKGHYIPIIMQTIGDESQIDTEERRYYQQNYQFQVQGFLLDEEEFEVKPAITRSLVMFGFDEKDRKGDPKTLGKNNSDKVKNKISFVGSASTFTINYKYKSNINLIRTKNVLINSEKFFVNGLLIPTNVQVNPGDTLTITIIKTIASQDSTVTIEETLV